MKKATKRIIARIMAVMMVVSILPFDMWGTANVVMAEELSVTVNDSSESAGEDLAAEDDVLDTEEGGDNSALTDDTGNPEEAVNEEDAQLPEEADQTEDKEEIPAPVEDAEENADVENSEDGALEEADALPLLNVETEEITEAVAESDVADGSAENTGIHILNGNDFTATDNTGTTAQSTPKEICNGFFTVMCNSSNTWTLRPLKDYRSSITVTDETAAGLGITTDTYAFGFSAKLQQKNPDPVCGIRFTISNPATVTVVFSANDSAADSISIYKDKVEAASLAATSTVTANRETVASYTTDLDKAGTYYIGCASRKTLICYLKVEEKTEEKGDPSVTFTDEGAPKLTQAGETEDVCGKTRAEDELSLSYTLAHKDGEETSTIVGGDEKDASTVAWYRVDSDEPGENDATEANLIKTGGLSYELTSSDVGHYIMVAVTPSVALDDSENPTGKTAYVGWKNKVGRAVGTPPNIPTGNPEAGVVKANQQVTLSAAKEDEDDGAEIYYTTDGTAPTVSEDGKTVSGTKYDPDTPITIDKALTISAIAVILEDGKYLKSDLATLEYTIANTVDVDYTLDFNDYDEVSSIIPFTAGIYKVCNNKSGQAKIQKRNNLNAYRSGGGATYNNNPGRLIAIEFPSGTEQAKVTIKAEGAGTSKRYIALADNTSKLTTSSSEADWTNNVYGAYTSEATGAFDKTFTVDSVDENKEYALIMSGDFYIFSITVTATGEIPERTITFYNGTEQVGSKKVYDGGTVTVNDQPEVTPEAGKKFVYWYEEGSATAFDFTLGVTANKELHAKWEDITYTVTYHNNYTEDGVNDVYDTQTIKYNETVTAPTEPTRGENYRFLGWCTDENGEEKYTFGSTISEDLDLFANWQEIIKHTVTFYQYSYEDGSGTKVDVKEEVKIEKNLKVEKPTNPTRDDYTFEGWYTDAACTEEYDFDTAVTENITLYAKWKGYAAMPIISPDTDEITQNTPITLTSTTDGATLYYTIDDSTPSASSNPYTDKFTLGEKVNVEDTVTIMAIAIAEGYNDSKVAKRTYKIVSSEGFVNLPESNVTIGKVSAGTKVTLSADDGAVIYYTTDGKTDPVTNEDGSIKIAESAVEFDEDIVIGHTTTIKAAAVSYDESDAEKATPKAASQVASFTYEVDEIKPVADPESGEVDADEVVILYIPDGADEYTDEVVIYYTTDGTNPNTGSDVYNDDTEIFISDDMTVKAIAVYDGHASGIATFVYTLKEYTVTFESNGGSEVEAQTLKSGQKVSKPDAPAKRECAFDGWYTDVECTDEYDFTEEVTDNITLYAKWDELQRVLINTTEWNFTTEYFNSLGLTGTSVNLKAEHDLDGITVGGTANAVKAKTEEVDLSVGAGGIIYIPISSGTEAVKITITLQSSNNERYIYIGTGDNKETVYHSNLNANVYVEGSPYFVNKVYTNEDLYLKSDGMFDTTLAIQGNAGETKISSIILKEYRLVSENTEVFTVQFDTDEGSDIDDQSVISGEKVTRPADPTKTGYTFGGWYTDADCTEAYNFNAAVTEDITLYAKWTEITTESYTVQFNTNGGGEIDEQNIVSGGIVTKPTDPTKTGYTFEGWYKDAACTEAYDFNAAVTEDITLYAKWTPVSSTESYTVQFNTSDGSTIDNQSVVSGDKATKPADPTKTGYTFEGWYKDAACTEAYDFNAAVTEDITLYAKWTPVSSTDSYTVQFNTDGGSTIDNQSIAAGGKATQPTNPMKTGYTFGGWYKDAACTEAYDFNAAVTGDITLYAKWTPVSSTESYTVQFNTNGGSTIDNQSVVSGDKATKPTDPTKTGYTFGGWYKDAACTEAYDFNAAVTEDITLYAKWTPVSSTESYTVQFNTNGGSTIDNQSVVSGDKATKPADPTRTGYTFVGWYTDEECTESNKYDFTEAVTADITLYAKWMGSAAKPVISPATQKITKNTPISLNSTTDGAVIYYTTDGSNPSTNATKYESAFTLGDTVSEGDTVTIKAIATATGYNDSDVTEFTYTIVSSEGYVNVPHADVTPGTVDAGKPVVLSADENAVIYYTTDGTTDPVVKGEDNSITIANSATKYSDPVTIKHTTTIKAAAVVLNGTEPSAASDVVTFDYTVEEKKPVASPAAGAVDAGARVTLSIPDGAGAYSEDVKIYYTTNGNEPDTSSNEYTTEIVISEAMTIKAIAVYDGFKSEVATFVYTIKQGTVPPAEEEIGLKVHLKNPDESYIYTGKAITPEIIVKNNGETLTEGIDYTVKYSNNVKATPGNTDEERKNADDKKKAKITVTGKGNLTGSAFTTFVIEPRDIGDEDYVKAGSIVVVENSKATPVLIYGSMKLGAKDYDITSPEKNHKWTKADTQPMVITGKGNFKGTLELPVKVVSKGELKKFTVVLDNQANKNITYDGTEKTPEFKVYDSTDKVKSDATALKAEEDYTVVYPEDLVSAGKVNFTVVGIGEYSGSITKNYTIKPDTSGDKISIDASSIDKNGYPFVSTGVTIDDDLVVTYDDEPMVLGKDYKISYKNNKKVGTDVAKYTISFIGSYKGTKTVKSGNMTGSFTITPCKLNDENAITNNIKVAVADKVYTKPMVYKSAPYVTVDGVLLKASNYKVSYWDEKGVEITSANKLTLADNQDSATVTVKIEGKGNYLSEGADDHLTATFKVSRKTDSSYDLSKAKVTVIDDKGNKLKKMEYDGDECMPLIKVELKVGKTYKDIDEIPELSYDDLDVSYVNNVNKGKATIVINGDGQKFVGCKTASFSIVSKNVKNVADLFKDLF